MGEEKVWWNKRRWMRRRRRSVREGKKKTMMENYFTKLAENIQELSKSNHVRFLKEKRGEGDWGKTVKEGNVR